MVQDGLKWSKVVEVSKTVKKPQSHKRAGDQNNKETNKPRATPHNSNDAPEAPDSINSPGPLNPSRTTCVGKK